MSPSPVGGWVFVKNENMSESGCFIAARLDFQLLGFSTSLKPSGSLEGCAVHWDPVGEELPAHALFTNGLFKKLLLLFKCLFLSIF